MSVLPFPHDGPMSMVSDDRFTVAYYARDGKKYKRVKELGKQAWKDTVEQEITAGHFYMVVACIERRKA